MIPGAGRWVWLVGALVLPALRWLSMSSAQPFKALLPKQWFWGHGLGLTRLSLNVALSWALLVIVPALVIWLYRTRSLENVDGHTSSGLFRCQKPSLDVPKIRLLLVVGSTAALVIGVLGPMVSEPVSELYPLFRGAGRCPTNLVISESLTLALVLATELYYRGVALTILHDRFGPAAIYILAIAYCVDHIGAPASELVGSLVVGVFLGHLALKTRSIWPGFALHAFAAVAVDLTSLALEGQLWFQPG